MKKITCLLSLLLLCAGAMKATAQVLLDRSGWTVTTSGECDDSGTGHATAITDGNPGTFWHSNFGGGNSSGDNSKNLPQFFQVDLGSEQTFQTIAYLPRMYGGANGDAKAYKVYVSNTPFVSRGSDGKIVYGSTTGVDNNAASIVNNLNASDLYIEGTVDYSGFTQQTYIFKSGAAATTSRYLLFVVTSSGGDQPNKFANCAEFQLVNGSVADAENQLMVQVTYNYYINDALYKSVTVKQNRNSVAAAPAQDFINNFSYDVTSVGTEDCTVRVNCNENLPFVVTTDLNNAKWYAWRMHSNQPKFLSYNVVNNKVAYAEKTVTDYSILSDNAYFWCITGNLVDGFKLYNKAVGTTQSLSYASGAPVLSAEDANNTWKLVKSTANSNWFCLQRADMTEGNKYMNLDLGNGLLTYWNAADAGSSIFLHTPASFPLNYAAGYINLPSNAVGQSKYLTGENMTNARAALAAAQADQLNFSAAQALAGVAANVANNGSFVEMAPGYYRIYSAQPGLYARNRGLIYDSNSGKMCWNEVTKRNVNNIVKMEAADEGKYYLYACNAQKYMQGVAGALGNAAGETSGITVTALGNAQYNLVFGNGTMHANGHNEGLGTGSTLVGWDGSANSASAWYIIPATDLEVALHTVDGVSYASAYLPFPVQGEGIYTGTIDGNGSSLNMTAQTGVVPAKTGIVIKSANSTATLTIGGSADADVSDNSLKGTLNALTGDLTNYLVLGVSNHNTGIGFFTPSERLTTIGANKAYLLAAEVSSASHALAMNFGGEATGVGTVITENGIQSNAPVFDLSGRRVMQTVKGGLYIQNGKKFIVK